MQSFIEKKLLKFLFSIHTYWKNLQITPSYLDNLSCMENSCKFFLKWKLLDYPLIQISLTIFIFTLLVLYMNWFSCWYCLSTIVIFWYQWNYNTVAKSLLLYGCAELKIFVNQLQFTCKLYGRKCVNYNQLINTNVTETIIFNCKNTYHTIENIQRNVLLFK